MNDPTIYETITHFGGIVPLIKAAQSGNRDARLALARSTKDQLDKRDDMLRRFGRPVPERIVLR